MHYSLKRENIPSLLLRIGLSFVFAYAAISAFHEPDAWIYFVPHFITNFVSAKTFLDLFSTFQIILALALITGKFVRYAALLAVLSLGGLLVFNLTGGKLLITFRDVGLTFMAAALFVMELPAPKKKTR